VFGKLPAREREKIIKDNWLCLFCLLHDKDKPCGAKQKPVACSVSNCKGRHIQKLHDFLKGVFREESQVHVVHRDDEWEESEEAWELGGEEMMIVGTVQQEDDCSWQDASKSWLEQGEKEEVEVYQVGACQGADGAPLETERGVGICPPASQRDNSEAAEDGWRAPGPGGLLIEGEEGEYFLELLMREAPPEKSTPASSKTNQLAGSKADSESKTTPVKSKGKKKNKKKSPKEDGVAATQPEGRKIGVQKGEESTASRTSKHGKPTAPDPLSNPEAKGRGLVSDNRTVAESKSRSTTTSRGECS
jgi:hypothetical protein